MEEVKKWSEVMTEGEKVNFIIDAISLSGPDVYTEYDEDGIEKTSIVMKPVLDKENRELLIVKLVELLTK